MTGKDLKEFAASLHDEALIYVRERPYAGWAAEFQIRASTVRIYQAEEIVVDANKREQN